MKKMIAVLLVTMTLLSLAVPSFAEAYRPSSSSSASAQSTTLKTSSELIDCPWCHQHTCWKDSTNASGMMDFTLVRYWCMRIECGYRAESFTGISGIAQKIVY